MKFLILLLLFVKSDIAVSLDHSQDCPQFNELGWEICSNGKEFHFLEYLLILNIPSNCYQ